MPRQLPWKGGAGSRTQTTKPPVRPSRPTRILDDIDDDLFEGAALASASNRVKDRTRATSGSDNSLPEPYNEELTPRSKRSRTKDPKERPPSSSSPPLADYALPRSEPMRKGVSKFDLRDDEWMMVEDEFLDTAKLFTKHLHIAEYDRLKETIEAKKRELALARPVVAGAERSAEGALRAKAKAQEIRQKQAIRDVFASQGDSSEDDISSDRRRLNQTASTTVQPQPRLFSKVPSDTDSDDLDARRLPKAKPTAAASASKPTAPIPKPTTPIAKPTAPSSPPRVPNPTTSTFARPALPPAPKPSRPRPNASRMTPFDMLDEYTPPPPSSARTQASTPQAAKPRAQPTPSPRTSQPTTRNPPQPLRSQDITDDWSPVPGSSTTSKEALARMAKRKAERAKGTAEKGEKGGSAQLDDMPTFLF